MEREKQRRFKEFSSPFDYNYDIVTDATHKSLRGPRGIILYRRGTKLRKQGMVPNCGDDTGCDFEEKISFALDPTLQRGLLDNDIAALYIVYTQQITCIVKME